MKLELLDLPGYAEFVDYRKEPGVIYLVRLDQPRKHFFYVGRTGQCNPVVEAAYRAVAGLFEDYKGVCSKVEVLGAQVDGMIGYDGHLLNEATTEPERVKLAEALHNAGLSACTHPGGYSKEEWNDYRLKLADGLIESGIHAGCGDACNFHRMSEETNEFWNELRGWKPRVEEY